MAKQKRKSAKKSIDVPLDKIDDSPAASVRAELDAALVKDYGEKYEAGERLPDVDLFEGKTKFYLGDGRHRVRGKADSGGKTINANVRSFVTNEEAEEAALDFSAGANEQHGKRRTAADKWLAVGATLKRKSYATASDNEVARVCKVGHNFVRQVREKMTADGKLSGQASATERPYKPDATLRAGATSDGKGGLVKVQPVVQVARPEEPKLVEALKMPLITDPVDSLGRAVPERWRPAFRLGKAFAADVRGTLSELLGAIKEAGGEPWGCLIPGTLQSIEVDAKNIREAVRCAIPFAVCPHIGDGGSHEISGRCRVCSDRGWITRGTYSQLTPELRELISRRGGTKNATEDD